MTTSTPPVETAESTERLVGTAVIEACRTNGDVWSPLRRLRVRPDAGRVVVESFRSADDPLVRWALVVVAAHLRRSECLPMLVEAGTPCEPSDHPATWSAARIASSALAICAESDTGFG